MLRVRLLGDLTIEVDGNRVELPASRRARSLLGWLALDRRMHARSGLAARFWPDVLDESARTSLRGALSSLRRALGPNSERYLVANRDKVGLAGDALVWTDVGEFDRCVAAGRLEEALELSRDELLAGLDDDWVYEHRGEHRDRVASVLARLAARAERDHDLRAAIGFTRRQAALDPLVEEPQRDLMRRLAAAGDRAAAIRTYERFSRRLHDELRILPSHATRELAEALRHGAESPGPVASPPAAAIERRIGPPPRLVIEDPGPLVGRDAELEELDRHWRAACSGRGRVALLVGEPGIGKTALAAEFSRASHAEGAIVLFGCCYEESLVPYQPFVEALSHYVSGTPLDDLRLQLGSRRSTLARLLPALAVTAPEPPLGSGGEDPERAQFMLFDAVASLLLEVAQKQPLLLVLDDLHWADAPTLLLLRHIVRAPQHAPFLILGTYRETEVDQAHPLAQALAELRRARAGESLRIGGLGEEDVAALISSWAGREAPAGFAQSIADRTEGNPFFVEEVLRDIGGGENWSSALSRIEVPESVKDLLLRRLRRLDERCKRLLTFAAVSGREFSLEVLDRLTDMGAEQIAEALEQAIAAQVIGESSGLVGRYSFGHALIRETIYDQLSRTRRAQLHRLTGEAIEAAGIDQLEQHASVLAHHFSAAGMVAKAYEYHGLAASASHRVYAIEPALTHYTAALESGVELGLSAEREPMVRRLLLQRGRLRYRTGDPAGAGADFQAALGGARRAGDRIIEMETLNDLGVLQLRSDLGAAAASHEAALEIAQELGDPTAQTQALDRLSVVSSHLFELDRGLELGERALELARGTGDPSAMGRAVDSIKLAALQLGDLQRLKELTDELERLWRERSDLWYLQWTLLESAFVPIGAARWDEAADRLSEAAAINRHVRDPLAEALILDALCWLHRSRGAYEEALSAGRRALALGTSVGWGGWMAPTLGCLLLELGAPTLAAEVLERGVIDSEGNGDRQELARSLSQLAWARWLLGRRNESRSLAARAQELLERVSVPPGGAFLFGVHAYTAIARIQLAADVPDGVEALLRPLLAAAERSGWREAAAATELVLGLGMEARGELDQAAELLAGALEIAEQYGIAAPGWEAHAALARVHRAAGRSREADEHLTTAQGIVDRVAASLKDPALRDCMRNQVVA